jgi:predicted secreted hydrolase
VTDDATRAFHFTERRSRGNFGDAGAATDRLNVWNGPWRAELENDTMNIEARSDVAELKLELTSQKPLVLHGENGFSKKGPLPGQASYYTSFTRLHADGGTLILHGKHYTLTAADVWFDHEFTSSEIARGTLGWDWFAVQLSTGEELMLYQLRGETGEKTSYSSATFVDRDGKTRTLPAESFSVEVRNFWRSPKTGKRYPAEWKISVPALNLSGTVTPTVAGQELVTPDSTRVTYWEGRATFSGERAGTPLTGNAYVELVGYK